VARQDFNALIGFLAVAEERNFTRAATRLGVAQSTFSHSLNQLEQRLGFRLLTRTTRRVSTTEAGERLLCSLVPRVAEIETEIDALMAFRDKPAGNIRITLSDHAFHGYVWPRLQAMLADYPDVNVEFSLDNGLRDIVTDCFDAGVRLSEGVEKAMIAVRIGPDWRLVAVASPAYFASRAASTHPHNLVAHRCIGQRQTTFGRLYVWEFARDGQECRVKVEGQLIFNTTFAIVDAALRGYGVAYVPENLVESHIRGGELVQVLDDWSPPFAAFSCSIRAVIRSRRRFGSSSMRCATAVDGRQARPGLPASTPAQT